MAKSTEAAPTAAKGIARREIDLGNQSFGADDAVGGAGDGRREERPRQEPQVGEQGVRAIAAGHARHPAQEHREDHHHQRRLEDRPGRAQHRLLVAHLHVAPHQEVQQLAVAPQLADVDQSPAAGRLQHRCRRSTERVARPERACHPARRRGFDPGQRGGGWHVGARVPWVNSISGPPRRGGSEGLWEEWRQARMRRCCSVQKGSWRGGMVRRMRFGVKAVCPHDSACGRQ